MRTVLLAGGLLMAWLGIAAPVRADVVTEWNMKAAEVSLESRVPAPVATRLVATAAVAVSDGLLAITPRYAPILVTLEPAPGASVDATVAAASRGVLLSMSAGQKAMIEAAYAEALAKIPDGPARPLASISARAQRRWCCRRGRMTTATLQTLTGRSRLPGDTCRPSCRSVRR